MRPKLRERAVRQNGFDRDDVVAHGAVAHRAAAAGIIGRHAADGGARGGRDIDRKPKPVRLELAVEIVEHDARLDRAARALDVEIEDAGEILRAVDDQRFADRLPGLRRSAAPRQHADAFGAGDAYRPFGFFYRARGDHADRHDLVVRGVGGIAAARKAVEMHVPAQLGLQPPFQAGHHYRHGFLSFLGRSLSLCIRACSPCGKSLDRNVTFIVQRSKHRSLAGDGPWNIHEIPLD